VGFETQEAIFYAAMFLAGTVGGIVRYWRDGNRRSRRRVVGGCLSGGVLAFGAVGFWVGDDPGSIAGPFYYLAIAALIGFLSEELQTQLLDKASRKIADILKLGNEDDADE